MAPEEDIKQIEKDRDLIMQQSGRVSGPYTANGLAYKQIWRICVRRMMNTALKPNSQGLFP